MTTAGEACRVAWRDAARVSFEACVAVRAFPAYKRQRHFSGLWWSATDGRHVGFESWLERDHVMALDFDRSVAAIASQPFWLRWSTASGRVVAHAPDYFARRGDGMAVVVDCRPLERRPARDAAKFAATEAACRLLGWEYRLVGDGDPVVTRNLRWLAGYRHARHAVQPVRAALREAFAVGCALIAGAEAVGDPVAVLPVLFHMLWCGELTVDLTMPLHETAMITAAAEALR